MSHLSRTGARNIATVEFFAFRRHLVKPQCAVTTSRQTAKTSTAAGGRKNILKSCVSQWIVFVDSFCEMLSMWSYLRDKLRGFNYVHSCWRQNIKDNAQRHEQYFLAAKLVSQATKDGVRNPQSFPLQGWWGLLLWTCSSPVWDTK